MGRRFPEPLPCITAVRRAGLDLTPCSTVSYAAMVFTMRYHQQLARLLGVCIAVTLLGQRQVRAQIAGVQPSLGGQPVLIEPTTVPGYKDCIKNVSSTQCVSGNGIRAQAPFDPSTACPSTPLYDITGQLVSNTDIANQVKHQGSHSTQADA